MLKVAIVGFGNIAQRAHVPSFMRLKNVEIACVVDSNPKALRIAKNKFNIKNVSTDFNRILEDDIDIVDICTPPLNHADLCILAAENGKNVLVEKPVAISVREAESIKNAVEKRGVKLCIATNYRYNPVMLQIKELQKKNEFGNILTIHVIVHTITPNPKLEAFWKIDSLLEFYHSVDLLFYLGGKVNDVYAYARSHLPLYLNADYNAILKFDKGAVGYLDWARVSSCNIFLVDIYGSGQCLRGDFYRNTWRKMSGCTVNPFEEVKLSSADSWNFLRTKMFNSVSPENIGHYILISNFIRSILTDTRSPVPIDEGIEVLKILEAIKISANKTGSLSK